jgi:glycosyltransferase involved in cell wall biosynthesis
LGVADSYVVGFLGTVRPHKGLLALADAVAASGPETKLLLAGDVSDHTMVAEIVGRAQHRVLVIDRISMFDVPAYLGACDVVAVPQSRSTEARYQSPAKIFDALAAGRPVVAGDIGDAREIVGDAGILVAPGDAAALSTAFADLLRDPARRTTLGNAGIARMARYFSLTTWQRSMAELLEPHLHSQTS